MKFPQPHLLLFLTRRMSLATWHNLGTLDRELAVYRRLLDRGVRVSLVSHGQGSTERELVANLPEFTVAYNRWRLPRRLYERAIPWLFSELISSATVIKTNQTNGAQFARAAAQHFSKPLIARAGYLWSSTEATNHGLDSAAARQAEAIEAAVFRAANRIVVTTDAMAANIKQRFPETMLRVQVIPNFVDTDHFSPSRECDRPYDLVFVGRLAPEKNVAALLEAIQGTSLRLLMIGGGVEQSKWQHRFRNLNEQVTWLPQIPHLQLPQYLNSAKSLVLPSLYEGHPKVAIEAMACGLPVIGSDVAGIRELVVHERTGLLCGTSAESIRAVAQRLVTDARLRESCGNRARVVAVAQFSLEHITDIECRLVAELSRDSADKVDHVRQAA